MSFGTAKRFWTNVVVTDLGDGFGIELDGRPVKTPAKAALHVPNRALAEAVAREWAAVEAEVDPSRMPFTRSANAAIDKVTPQFQEVADMLAAYGASDLLCYRADAPAELVQRQNDAWDPLIAWAEDVHDARLVLTAGLMPVEQPAQALASLAAPLYQATPFELTALHDLIAISGSVILGLAVAENRLSAADGWSLSRIDERWQADQWGDDEEAVQQAEIKRSEFLHAANLYELSRFAH